MIARAITCAVVTIAALLALASSIHAQSTIRRSPAGIAYEVSGSGDPVVLVHGFTLDRHMWDPQVKAFANRYRLVAYDLRGHGDSAGAEQPFTAYGDLLDLLDSLAIERATIVGLSAGSELAINFAIVHPDRVTRLVLASPGLGGYRGSALPWMQPVIEAITAGQPEEASRRWLKTPLMRLVTGVDAQSNVNQMVMRNAGLWMAKRVEQPLTPPAIGRLSAIQAPVLVVLGEEDQPHIRDIANIIVAGVPGATLTTIPGAAHLVNLDAPRMFNEVVGRFLAAR